MDLCISLLRYWVLIKSLLLTLFTNILLNKYNSQLPQFSSVTHSSGAFCNKGEKALLEEREKK